jgi:hypothetical protein
MMPPESPEKVQGGGYGNAFRRKKQAQLGVTSK